MTTKQVASLVDEAIALDRQIASLESELTQKKQSLVAEAERALRADGTATPDLAGCSYTFNGDSAACTVSFPKPKLISGFWLGKKGDQEIAFRTKDSKVSELGPLRELAGAAFTKLFAKNYKPAKAFRDLAAVLLPKATAAKLVDLCQEPSSPRVSFETKEAA